MKNTKNPPGQVKNDITLKDYLDRKYIEPKPATKEEYLVAARKVMVEHRETLLALHEGRQEPLKLTFDEWFKKEGLDDHQWDVANMAWKAAQENK